MTGASAVCMVWRTAGSLLAATWIGCAGSSPGTMALATTTSVGHSGLLELLLPAFEAEAGIALRAHLVGSGRALRMLERGDVDVAISHAPAREAEYLTRHPDWAYRKIMYNDFVIAGPPADSAGVRDANSALEAMRRIAQQPRARFVSRGDSSGTHERESELWRACGARPAGDRLVSAGQGMSGTLRVADEIGGYTLADRATMAQLAPAVTHLRILFERDPALINTYAVITSGNASPAARRFADWLARGDGRARIDAFRVRGARAFFVWPEGQAATTPGALPRP